MSSPKSVLLFFASFIVIGLFVLLIDQMFPTSSANNADFQAYTSKDVLQEMEK